MPPSRTLVLMRHAEAGGAPTDHERPLTIGGWSDAAAAGEWIRESLPAVGAVVCSTALRTRQTLIATGIEAPTVFAEELYGGGIDDILGQIGLSSDAVHTLLVVGHAPGIPSTAYELVTIAALAAPEPDEPVEFDDSPKSEDLRHFSACAVAVLATDASWADLNGRGAELLTVRHPRS